MDGQASVGHLPFHVDDQGKPIAFNGMLDVHSKQTKVLLQPLGRRRSVSRVLLCCFITTFLLIIRYQALHHVIGSKNNAHKRNGAKIAIVTLKFGEGGRHNFKHFSGELLKQDLYDRSHRVLQSYAKRWQYPLYVSDKRILEEPRDATRKGLLSKEAALLSVILLELQKPKSEERLKWIYYVDADAVIVNHEVNLEAFLPTDQDFSSTQMLLIATDQWGTLNSGGFFIKVCEDSVHFLSTMIAESISRPLEEWDGSDQALMAIVAKSDHFVQKVSLVPSFWFNADALKIFSPKAFKGKVEESYQLGDFMVHFMGGAGYKKGWTELLHIAEKQSNLSAILPLPATRYMSPDIYRNPNFSSIPDTRVTTYWDWWIKLPVDTKVQKLRSTVNVRILPTRTID